MLQFIILILLAISYYAGWQMCKAEWKFMVECKDAEIPQTKEESTRIVIEGRYEALRYQGIKLGSYRYKSKKH